MKKKITLISVYVSILVTIIIVGSSEAQYQYGQLQGYVQWANGDAAQGIVMSISGYSVSTNQYGYYSFGFLYPGQYVISISPPGRLTRSFWVTVTQGATRQDFIINW
ncbi:carboxypeptidase regulatory-like domain-containing protein [bacterium]|jgi:hypothetical protein|nr:carboxypeptidase regulatory-like domain-containing protein [bacterium]